MTRIELNEKEIAIIEKDQRGEFDHWDCTDEEKETMATVIDKAYALMEELDAYEESGSDVIKWFYDKYKEQGKS